jgi:hypothetical protein
MYVLGARSASFLGNYILPQKRGRRRGLSGLGYRPNQATQRIYSKGGRRRLGDDSDPFDFSSVLDPSNLDTGSSFSVVPAGSYDSLPSDAQAYALMASQATPITNPTDYVSPAAAIAGGVPAAQVNAAWATPQGVNSFSSPSAATAALTATMGAAQAAATVAKLWTGGGTAPPTSAGFLSQSTAGIPNAVLIGGGLLIVLIGAMGGKR